VLLFTSGEQKAEVLMISVGFEVIWLRTYWYRQKKSVSISANHPVCLSWTNRKCFCAFWSYV